MRSLWLPLVGLFLIFFTGIYFGQAATGWLLGMSCAVILIIAQTYADAIREPRYWCALTVYLLLHIGVLAFSSDSWIPKPTAIVIPVFLLDYLAMGFAFPKLSGLVFDGG